MVDIIVIGILCITIVSVLIFSFRRKKAGKSCSCQCGGCSKSCDKI